jgi:PAS domain S-box-containing protein
MMSDNVHLHLPNMEADAHGGSKPPSEAAAYPPGIDSNLDTGHDDLDTSGSDQPKRVLDQTWFSNENQAIYQLVFENAPDAYVLTDFGGCILGVNQQTETLFGYARENLIGKNDVILFTEQFHYAYSENRVGISRNNGQSLSRVLPDFYGLHQDGHVFPVDVTLCLLEMDTGNRILSVIRDIFPRKEADKALTEQTGLVQLLQDIAAVCNLAETLEVSIQYSIERICQFTEWPIGHAYLSGENHKLIPLDILYLDDSEQYRPFFENSDQITFEKGIGIPGQVLYSGEPAWLLDIDENPQFIRREAARGLGLKSVFAFPILIQREVVGVLEFFSNQNIIPNKPFLKILPNIGAQIGRVVERTRVIQKLKQQEDILRTILETLPVGVLVSDETGTIVLANQTAQEIWGGARFVGIADYGEYKGWWAKTGDLIQAEEWALARAITQGETSVNEAVNIEAFDGTRKIILNSAIPLHDHNRRIIGAIAVNQDITQGKQMEVELAEVQRRLLESIESERMRLAQDLHDGPIQDLYGVSYQLRDIQEPLRETPEYSTITIVQTSIQEVISSLRNTMVDLRPPTLIPFGLEKALRSYADRFQTEHPELFIYLDLMPDRQSLPEHVRLALYRNCQQLLSNIVRHARAQNVWIRLIINTENIILEIQDDGLGFTTPHRWVEFARRGHLGLLGASERAEALGGRLEVESLPGEGALIRTIIPWSSLPIGQDLSLHQDE